MEGNKGVAQTGSDTGYIGLTSDIVSAYVSNNQIQPGDVASLIGTVHNAIRSIAMGGTAQPQTAAAPEQQRGDPPVSIKKSMTPDFLISLEDGKRYKSLKRHLSGHGLTPEQYRSKWGLPANYPMVAPNYALARSELAKKMGLGQKRSGAAASGGKARKAAKTGTGRGRKKAA